MYPNPLNTVKDDVVDDRAARRILDFIDELTRPTDPTLDDNNWDDPSTESDPTTEEDDTSPEGHRFIPSTDEETTGREGEKTPADPLDLGSNGPEPHTPPSIISGTHHKSGVTCHLGAADG